MNAGRELDAMIAETVMGWRLADRRRLGWGDGPECWFTGDADSPTRQSFSPSTDIADAWLVAEKMIAEGTFAHIAYFQSVELWRCEFTTQAGQQRDEWGYTAPLAICKAALAAARVPA